MEYQFDTLRCEMTGCNGTISPWRLPVSSDSRSALTRPNPVTEAVSDNSAMSVDTYEQGLDEFEALRSDLREHLRFDNLREGSDDAWGLFSIDTQIHLCDNTN